MQTAAAFDVQLNGSPVLEEDRAAALADPGFGRHFSDHMVLVDHDPDGGWHDARVRPFGPLSVLPGSSALQYAQQVFEGLKVYRHPDGSVQTFRPLLNAERLRRSAARVGLVAPDDELFLEALRALVDIDHAWVPDAGRGSSLYLRPFVLGTEQFLGVRPSRTATFGVIAAPAASFFSGGQVEPVDLWLAEGYSRAAPGGTGEAKCGGNYAAGLAAQAEAYARGCSQAVFLDARTQRYVEELGGMNLVLVTADGRLVTPELSGTILRGITRRSLLQLGAEELGLTVEERPVTLREWRDGVSSGTVTEVFACGTAAVVTPIGRLVASTFSLDLARETGGRVTTALRTLLTDIQHGRVADARGWMTRLR